MKKHQFLSFLKGAALACLTFAAFSGTCFTLTSCGGGGDEGETTEITRAGKYLEGKYLTLQAQNVACTVELGEHLKGTNIVMANISYGDSFSAVGSVFISEATMSEDVLQSADIKVTTQAGKLTEEDDFKRWWAAGTGENADEKKFLDAMTIQLDFKTFTSTKSTGTYVVEMMVLKDGGEPQDESLSGEAVLSREPFYN